MRIIREVCKLLIREHFDDLCGYGKPAKTRVKNTNHFLFLRFEQSGVGLNGIGKLKVPAKRLNRISFH